MEIIYSTMLLITLVFHITSQLDWLPACSPCFCSCIGSDCQGLSMDCNGKGLLHIPTNIPCMTEYLDLQKNKITELGSELACLTNLTSLVLSENKLKVIARRAFASQLHLTELNLAYNEFDQDSGSIPVGVFDPLINLKVLQIQAYKGAAYRDELLLSLAKLEILHIDGPPSGEQLSRGFSKLLNLRSLALYGDFNYISNTTFKWLQDTNLQKLSINSGKLYDVEPLALSYLHELRELSFSFNENLGFTNMSKGWYGLRFTKISSLFLDRAVPISKEIIILHEGFYSYLNATKIKYLSLEKNQIVSIASSKFGNSLPYLETLSLANNRLELSTSFLIDIHRLKNLKTLRLSDQSSSLPYKIGDAIHHYRGRGQINEENAERMLIPDFPSLQTVDLQNALTNDFMKFPDTIVIGMRHIKQIDLSRNRLIWLIGPVDVLHCSNENIDLLLDNNDAKRFSPSFITKESFDRGLKIVTLDLSLNFLGDQLGEDEEVFARFKDLRCLKLRSNNIKYLRLNTFKNNNQLETLDLSDNPLRSLEFSITQLTCLKIMDIGDNELPSLTESSMVQLDKLQHEIQSELTIDLSGNPLHCTCTTLHFLVWMQRKIGTKIHFTEGLDYFCLYDDTEVRLGDFYKNNIASLERHCASRTYAIVSGGVASITIVALIVSVIAYRHRWEIKFYCIKFNSQRKKYQEVSNKQTYTYDAFVAFHINDMDWVKNALIPALEQKNKQGNKTSDVASGNMKEENRNTFKLCVHHRDFPPGKVIQENIIDSINSSFKTILVLSNSFVTSDWCEFELQMANLRCFDEGRDVIVVVMLETVPAAAMSKSLRALIRRTTYIEWPKVKSQESDFWQRLKEVLKAPEVIPLVCDCGKRVMPTTAHNSRSDTNGAHGHSSD